MPRCRALRLAAWAGLGVTWLAVSALALDERPALLLLNGGGRLGARIAAELEAQGFRVVLGPPAPQLPAGQAASEATDAELASLAQGAQATAVVRVSARSVEVWRLEKPTADAPGEPLRSELPAAGDAERIVAARVVELLRTSALDLAPAPPAARAAPTAAAPEGEPGHRPAPPADALASGAAAPGRPALGALLLDLDAGLSAGTGGLEASPLLGASVFWQPLPLAAFGLAATLPLSAPELSAAEGSARIRSWSVSAGTRLYPFGSDATLQPFVGLGLGVLGFDVEGTRASSTLELDSEQLVVAGPHAALGVRWHALGRLWLTSRVEATYALAKPVVEFADRHVATLGRPFVLATLGIEFRALGAGSGD